MKTNATVTIIPKTKDWKGQVTLGVEQDIQVWLEESTQTRYSNGSQVFYAAGYFITTIDLPYKNYSVKVNGELFDIFNMDRLSNSKGFHHSEVFYK